MRFEWLATTFIAGCGAVAPTPAAPAASVPALPRDLFHECGATSFAGRGWKYVCSDVVASVGDHDDVSPESLLAGAVSGLRMLPGSVEAEQKEIVLAARRGRAVQVTSSDPDRNLLAIADAVLLQMPAGARIVTCVARATDDARARCREMLEQLASTAWRGPSAKGSTVMVHEAALAGRVVNVPEGCKVFAQDNGGVVACAGKESLTWVLVDDPSRTSSVREAIINDARKTTGGQLTETRIPCSLEGVPTECVRLGGGDGAIFVASAAVRGHTVVAMCVSPQINSLPKACAQTLQLGPVD